MGDTQHKIKRPDRYLGKLGRTQTRRSFNKMFLALFPGNAIIGFATLALFFTFGKPDVAYDQMVIAIVVALGNIVFVTLVGAGLNSLQTYYTVTKPLQKIKEGLDSVAAGDFTKPIELSGTNTLLDEVITSINDTVGKLGELETLKTGFVADMSHEIKTPLSIMSNYSALLLDSRTSEEQRMECAQAINEASNRLSATVSNILQLNKLENQGPSSNKTAFDLGEQLAECLLAFEYLWEERDIDVDVAFADGIMVLADEEYLPLIWNNLFSNAFKFTEPGGCVRVSLAQRGSQAEVSVQDNGPGMSEEERLHVFDRFYRGETGRSMGGNGLGLALAKRVADLEEASISVESELGKGTTFVVRIPLAEVQK